MASRVLGALDGATVTNFASTGIDDNADSVAITIANDETVAFTSSIGVGESNINEMLTVGGTVSLKEQASAPSATAGFGKVYALNDGKLYFKNDSGTEYDLTASGGSGGGMTGVLNYLTSGTFTVPAGVTKVYVEVWGAGGGGGCMATGGAGGASSFGSYASAGGGGGGVSAGTGLASPGAAGSGTVGDIVRSGRPGSINPYSAHGGASGFGSSGGNGGIFATGSSPSAAATAGAFPGGGGGGVSVFVSTGIAFVGAGGGGGGYAAKWVTGLTPGTNISVTVGTGGSPANGGCAAAPATGANGLVRVWY